MSILRYHKLEVDFSCITCITVIECFFLFCFFFCIFFFFFFFLAGGGGWVGWYKISKFLFAILSIHVFTGKSSLSLIILLSKL